MCGLLQCVNVNDASESSHPSTNEAITCADKDVFIGEEYLTANSS